MAIEILENTLLKIVVRQGTDSTRRNITLDSGELGYTTDFKRLFVGDGSTVGGILAGNKFQGSSTNATDFNPSEINDLAFESSTNKLKFLKENSGSTSTDWTTVGGVHTAADDTILFNSSNQVSVNIPALSGFTINPLYARYNGLSGSVMTYQKNVDSVAWISVGHYQFNYTLETANVIPQVQIYGDANLGYHPRIVALSNTACQVKVQNLSGGVVDVDLFFSIIR